MMELRPAAIAMSARRNSGGLKAWTRPSRSAFCKAHCSVESIAGLVFDKTQLASAWDPDRGVHIVSASV
jgi:hypothetical protein